MTQPTARQRIENLWDRATSVEALLDAYRDQVLAEAAARVLGLQVREPLDAELADLREQLAEVRAENLRLRAAWRNARLRAAGYRDRYHYERKLCHRADIRATAAIRAQLAAEAALAAASLPTT